MYRACFCVTFAFATLVAEEWPQFRGPAGGGVAVDNAKPPVEFGPSKSLLWKSSLPAGHSSPCVWGDRIFITGFDSAAKKLFTIALNRKTGVELWRSAIAPEAFEKVHPVSNPATATPATDGKRVFVYFGSYGVLAYTTKGDLAWETKLPLATGAYGNASSPVLAGDLVLIARDYNPEPQLLALSRDSGKLVWKRDLSKKTGMGPNTSHATPLVLKDEIVLHRPGELSGHSIQDGAQRWSVNLASSGTATPVATPEMIYVAGYTNFGEPDSTPELPEFKQLLTRGDANGDSKISKDEMPDDIYALRRPGVPSSVPGANMLLREYVPMLDTNKDGGIDESEWNAVLKIVKSLVNQRHGIAAVRRGGSGDMTSTGVAWVEHRNIPEVPSPLHYRDRIYMVMNGGIVSCLDANSGKVIYRGRTGAPGAYYSAPIAADGRIYTASGEGVMAVLKEADELSVLARNDIGEPIYATPAVIGPVIYVRTSGHLWAFGRR